MPDLGETTFICGSVVTKVPIIWIFLVGGAASVVGLGCILAALKMLMHPGETAMDHPKRRILATDR
jgi:hypothetical protein